MLELVAFDIETTGFTAEDEITVAGFAVPLGVRVFCQTDTAASRIEADVEAVVEATVQVSTHPSEAALLDAMTGFVADRFVDAEVLVVAYNGETWRGGFDLPFLRTRLAEAAKPWPFRDVPYADLLPIVKTQFNTATGQADADDATDLETVYEALCGGEYGALDPFDDSADAVDAFEAGQYTDLVLHNVADVLRTRALGRLAQRYCSKADFDVKSLTPVEP